MTRVHVAALAGVLVVSCATPIAQRQGPTNADATRQRPPATFSCPPNNLTTYTGVVTRYARAAGKATLRIRTDWDTTEDVTLVHQGTDDPSPHFRMNRAPFTPADWARIERRMGVLLDNVRAAAWVCSDGNVMVDWNVRRE